MIENDTYKTLLSSTDEILFKEKNSKFIGIAHPITNEEEVKLFLEQRKKAHPNAGHHCYAYQLGTETINYRTNDDGEPNNSAGLPIYGQIKSLELTNILLIVTRYYGGVKLGVGGLIAAYKNTAKLTLDEAQIIEKTININYQLTFEYKNLNKVMRVIKENNLEIQNQTMALDCVIEIATRKKNAQKIEGIFSNIFEISIKQIH
jgi:uncharacterized YigZ family protein